MANQPVMKFFYVQSTSVSAYVVFWWIIIVLFIVMYSFLGNNSSSSEGKQDWLQKGTLVILVIFL